jgi:hypothetical protein
MNIDAVENGQDAAEPVSGYELALTEPDRRLAVSLDGVVIWRSDHTVIAHHGPAETDAAGVSRLLVHEAVSRSVRRLQVLALEGESARPVWAAQGMASEMTPRFHEIAAALDAGAFDPHGFGLPAAPGEDIGLSEAYPVDTPALEAAIAAMGYQILTGEEAEAHDMTIAVMQRGERVWGVRAMMLGHHSLAPSDTPGAVDLLVEVRETRRYGTDYRLRLTPEGLTVISETDGGVTGFQISATGLPRSMFTAFRLNSSLKFALPIVACLPQNQASRRLRTPFKRRVRVPRSLPSRKFGQVKCWRTMLNHEATTQFQLKMTPVAFFRRARHSLPERESLVECIRSSPGARVQDKGASRSHGGTCPGRRI